MSGLKPLQSRHLAASRDGHSELTGSRIQIHT
eukprot:CAMPEP_0177369960 /NCGR_PEP_ID=MMETSP0368-20130122/41728_1 /TAXON_ID=447022 ORGANISM="Scrippsiella hangoei-like, Strain SHHI-4" /NCGR_SAMPLE_ID=MMETSP0368 /ASSEMBLY_ACC=CAM_ASM_000363 /LENGTH=31 /DNA_ID= /DNA_START= /DNA_END= /DNA_ORIENTATION=